MKAVIKAFFRDVFRGQSDAVGVVVSLFMLIAVAVLFLTSCTTPTSPSPCPTVNEYQNDTTVTKDSCVTGVTGGIENPGVKP